MNQLADQENMKFTKNHEWVILEDDIATIGITDFAQQKFSDIKLIELPQEDTVVNEGDEIASIESVKAVVQISAPISGIIVEVNVELEDSPEIINFDPYGSGWIVKIDLKNKKEWDKLMTIEEYEDFLETEDIE